MSGTGREMPKYKCHKEVWALKIKEIREEDDKEHPDTYYYYLMIPEEEGYEPIMPDREYMRKHQPKAGGYYVVYADGYKSFSPAEAFEGGYTRV